MTDQTPTTTNPDHEALERPKVPHISYSQLDKWRRCSLQWKHRYVDHLPDPTNLNLARGKAGHAALERDHMRKIHTGQNLGKEELLDTFSDAFDAFTSEIEPENLQPGDNLGTAKDNTVATLMRYASAVGPKMQPRVVEFAFSLDIPPSEQFPSPLKVTEGRIDLVEATGIYDNKFPGSRRAKSQLDADLSWQLTIYDMAFARLGIEVPNLGFIDFLPPSPAGREPADVKTTRRSAAELQPEQRQRRRDRMEYVIRTIQRQMQEGLYLPADDPSTCARCPYRKHCQSSLVKDDWTAMSLKGEA